MTDTIPSTVSTNADLFREEAERARRYAAAMTDQKVSDQLNRIAALYEALASGQTPGPTDRDWNPLWNHGCHRSIWTMIADRAILVELLRETLPGDPSGEGKAMARFRGLAWWSHPVRLAVTTRHAW
jgi:hypothetical protein